MDLASWVDVVVAAAAVGAVIFAGVQVWELRRERQGNEIAAVDGVAVQWTPTRRPNHAEDDGTGMWAYELVVRNPGRLPIRDIEVTWRFSLGVRLLHYDGALDEAVSVVLLVQPVILGGHERRWTRRIVLPFDKDPELRHTTADVTFTTQDGVRRTNHMNGAPPTILAT